MNRTVKKLAEAWEDNSVGVAICLSIGIIIGALAIAFCVMCFYSWLVMLLWNWVAVELFGLPTISFWMAFGLRWLCGLLFKSNTTVEKTSKN